MGLIATRFAITLFVVACSFVYVLSAQIRAPFSTPVKHLNEMLPLTNQPVRWVGSVTDERQPVVVSTSPILIPSRKVKNENLVQAEGVGAKVGFTYYDFQTNASMPNRLTYFQDGSDKYLQILWMTSKDSTRDATTRIPGFNVSRGSHYNFLDALDPDNLSVGIENWQKIEAERAGWPSIVQFDDGSIGTPSHTPIRFYANAGVGDEQFVEVSSVSTNPDTDLWPRAAIDGQNNVHLIYNKSQGTNNAGPYQVIYRRSSDGGSSWGPEVYLTGPTAVYWPQGVTGTNINGAGGDTYSIAARGSNVVVAFHDYLRVWYRKSTDYGQTWDDPTSGLGIVYNPTYTYVDSAYIGVDSIEVYSDTVPALSTMSDVIIDSEGKAHFAIGQYLGYIVQRGLADPSSPRTNYVNSVNSDALHKNTGIWYFKEGDTLIYTVGFAGGGEWDGEGTIVSRRALSGSSRYPQLGIDAQDNIYLAYTSVKTGDILPMQIDTTPKYSQAEPDTLSNVNGLFGHIYLTHKFKNYPMWSAPVNMTPDGSNSLFATLCDDVVNSRLYVAYSVSDVPGDRVTNVELAATPADIYVNAFDANLLNPITSVDEGDAVSGIGIAVLPNPADEFARVSLTGVTGGRISVSVVSTDGRRVAQSYSPSVANDIRELVIPTRDLSTGAYLLVVEQDGYAVTHRLAVVH
ncbi:MAG: T9SS type A sorting domain-containing protein [Ignavibacteria bacterium]|nr:T9SS type A sorting domain-containing protein [Ignavibacteria bacterium]